MRVRPPRQPPGAAQRRPDPPRQTHRTADGHRLQKTASTRLVIQVTCSNRPLPRPEPAITRRSDPPTQRTTMPSDPLSRLPELQRRIVCAHSPAGSVLPLTSNGCSVRFCPAHHCLMWSVDQTRPIRNSAIGAGNAPEASSCRSRVLLRRSTSVSSVQPRTGGSSGAASAGSDITAHLKDYASTGRSPGGACTSHALYR
jgi:hypothetical protein